MINTKELIDMALKAREYAYVPYSNFKVGAAILLNNGEYILGCNIENASYGLTNCAERTALFKLISEGYTYKDVKCMCIVGDTTKAISPCGACRQVMAELLNKNTKVILSNLEYDIYETTVEGLLPYAFDKGDL